MPVTKATLADSVFKTSDLQKNESIVIIDSLLEIIKSTLESGEDILISGFGKFTVKEKKTRKGRNPQTEKPLQLDARKVVLFRCSAVLREKINKKKKRKKSQRPR
jgi:integration host factor subunit alpha